MGPVVDIEFERGQSARNLECDQNREESANAGERDINLTVETAVHLGDNMVRCCSNVLHGRSCSWY